MTEVEKIFNNHSFTIDGTWYCSFDSVYDDLCDLFPHKNHEQICELMNEFQEIV